MSAEFGIRPPVSPSVRIRAAERRDTALLLWPPGTADRQENIRLKQFILRCDDVFDFRRSFGFLKSQRVDQEPWFGMVLA